MSEILAKAKEWLREGKYADNGEGCTCDGYELVDALTAELEQTKQELADAQKETAHWDVSILRTS